MPSKPLKPCSNIGCLNLTQNRFCEACAKSKAKSYDAERGTAAQRGYDSKWRKYRMCFLAVNPFCVKCLAQGKFVPATVVDHIKPHKGDPILFWDEKNHQGLCKSCHDIKTATEDGGFGSTPRG